MTRRKIIDAIASLESELEVSEVAFTKTDLNTIKDFVATFIHLLPPQDTPPPEL